MPPTHPFRSTPARALAVALALCAAAGLGGCSTLPERGFPPFLDHQFTTRCRAPADGRIEVPRSRPGLSVFLLQAEPPPAAERYDTDGGRYWHFAPGTEVTITCRCRAYAGADGVIPTARELLPAAHEPAPAPHE